MSAPTSRVAPKPNRMAEAAISNAYSCCMVVDHTILSEGHAVIYFPRMRKLFAAFFALAVCLLAADFWAKPSTEWSDKDLQKMITNSPWARSFNPPNPGGGLGDSGAPPPLSEGRGGRGGGGGGGSAPAGGPPGAGGPVPTIYARWQSALPVKQAFVRLK